MKRFALMFNEHPFKFNTMPWFNDNFDKIVFRPYVADLNNYDVIWIYTISGGNTPRMNKHFRWNQYPKYLRENGVTKPKIIYQEDYWHIKKDQSSYNTQFHAGYALRYADAIVYVGAREWSHLSKPAFYIPTPLIDIPNIEWIDFDEKEDAAVAVKRAYGNNEPSRKFADRLHIEYHELGKNIQRKPRLEYLEYIANHKIGLDYNDLYFGWSRFVAEAVYVGTPVIGPPHRIGCKIANPDLCGKNSGIMANKGRRLLTDKEYYEETRKTSYLNVKEHLSVEACEERIKKMLSNFCNNL